MISVAASLTFWVLDALMDKLMFYDEPFIEVLIGNKKEVLFRLLTSAFFLGLGLFAARAFAGQKRVEQDLIKEMAQRKCMEDAVAIERGEISFPYRVNGRFHLSG